jgi:VWFA-related protein
MIDPECRFTKPALSVLLFLLCSALFSQDRKAGQKKPDPDQTQFTFKVPVDVVVVNVTVTDKKGNAILDLTVDDFKIYEDGKAQPIHTFTLESYKAIQLPSAGSEKGGAEARNAAEAPNFTQPRLFSIMIDDVTSSREYYYSVKEAMRKFVEQDLGPGDQVAIFSGSGRVQHPFTSDRQQLQAEVDSLLERLDGSTASRSTCPTLTDLQAQRIANDVNDGGSLAVAVQETISCAQLQDQPSFAANLARSAAMMQYQETLHRSRILLQTLRQHIRSLKHFEARKNIILFSDGFLSEEILYDLQDVVDQALRAGVMINTVDIRGLYTAMFQASDNVIVSASLLGLKQRLLSEDASSQEDPLNQLAHDTGGIFHRNSNDVHAGLKNVSDRQAHSYVLSYAAPSLKADGRYHKIKLEVTRPGLDLAYRKGYYAPKEQLTFERKRKEDILEALRAPGNVNELPVVLSYNYYQVEDNRYEVEFVTRVDIRRMQFAEEETRRRNLISLVVVALDESDRYIDGSQKDVSFNLTPVSYSELLERGFASKVSFRVPPGRYKIRAVVRESVQSKMGSLTRIVAIP